MKEQIVAHLKEAFELGDEEIREIYGSYIETFGKQLEEMEKHLASGDFAELRRAAHTLKGCALNCGDSETADIALSLQREAEQSNSTPFPVGIAKLKSYLSAL